MKRRVVLFNGPPYCGKDSAAEALLQTSIQNLGFMNLDRFSMPLKRAFAGIMSLNITAGGTVDLWEAKKDEIIPMLGSSYRQWQIDFSECFMKPLYGPDIFGQLLVERFERRTMGYKADVTLLVPDSGFVPEANVVLARGYDVLLLRIHRPGKDFSSDSRSYIELGPRPNLLELDLQNDGDLPIFQDHVRRIYSSWIKSIS